MQESILLFFQDIASPALDSIAQIITMAGEQLIFIAVITYIMWNVSKRAGYALTYTLMVSSITNGMLKLLFHTPRPYQVIEGVEGKRLATAEGFSFPSGHTQGATTFFISLSIYLHRRRWITAAVIISLLVALSRVYLGVHWPIDVIGGLVFGSLFAAVVYSYIAAHIIDEDWQQTLNLVTGILCAVLSLAAVTLEMTHAVPADMLSGILKLSSITAGFTFGSYLEHRQIDYVITGTLTVKLLRYIMGILGALLILYGGKIVLPDMALFTCIRYTGAGFWAFYLYPLAGSHLSIDKEGNKLFVTT